MDLLDGIWRLVDSRAWEDSTQTWSTPYGANQIGQITFAKGRMLAVLCNGDPEAALIGQRAYSSYGGLYTFDGETLETLVDLASDPARIGSRQVRGVEMKGEEMLLRPPQRLYGGSMQRREIVWERVWRPGQTHTTQFVLPSNNQP